MNNIDIRYQELLKDILENGTQKGDRTGTGTISVFGRQIRHKMSDGFPLLTTKKMYFKGVVTELLWFLRGETNIKSLVENDCHIWDGDAFKNYFNKTNEYKGDWPDTKEEFINKIKTDVDFAKKWGDLGPVYGKQWRAWCGSQEVPSGWYHGAVTHFKKILAHIFGFLINRLLFKISDFVLTRTILPSDKFSSSESEEALVIFLHWSSPSIKANFDPFFQST